MVDLAINGRFLSQPTTGVQRVAHELTREIDYLLSTEDLGLNVRLLCPAGSKVGTLGLKSIKVEEVPGPKGWRWEQTALPKSVGDSYLLCLGNSAPVLSLLRKRPVALMIHDLSYRKFPSAYRLSYRIFHALLLPFLLRSANPLITVSRTERATLEEIDASLTDRIVVAQNGGWRERAGDEAPVARSKDGYALYVGSLSERKNFSGLLESAIKLAREDGLPFLFVGETGKVLAPVNRDLPEDVQDAIKFAGQVEDLDRLEAIYRGARCLVFPSFYEASPLPPIEAMHFGCPVVASSTPSMIERCGDAAEFCDPRDVNSIVAAVRRVIGDEGRATDLTERGLEWQRKYSWRSQARIVLNAIMRQAAARQA